MSITKNSDGSVTMSGNVTPGSEIYHVSDANQMVYVYGTNHFIYGLPDTKIGLMSDYASISAYNGNSEIDFIGNDGWAYLEGNNYQVKIFDNNSEAYVNNSTVAFSSFPNGNQQTAKIHGNNNLISYWTNANGIVSGQNVTINGNFANNKTTITGDGSSVHINGDQQQITVSGNNDTVNYSGNSGTIHLQGNNVTINANFADIWLPDNVTVNVTGAGNTIHMGKNDAVNTTCTDRTHANRYTIPAIRLRSIRGEGFLPTPNIVETNLGYTVNNIIDIGKNHVSLSTDSSGLLNDAFISLYGKHNQDKYFELANAKNDAKDTAIISYTRSQTWPVSTKSAPDIRSIAQQASSSDVNDMITSRAVSKAAYNNHQTITSVLPESTTTTGESLLNPIMNPQQAIPAAAHLS